MNAKYVKACLIGSLTDIVEMDAASNNGVEDVRAIREEVNFLPTLAKYRVYIIDEVHMLSTGAFNALLKTLEEPPKHVKFILATTEPQKLPSTILSRCQRFDFKTISDEDIIKRLKVVCNESNIEINDEALRTIATLSEGAMRDGLSILERCIQDGDYKIDESRVKELVGIPQIESIHNIIQEIVDNNVDKLIEQINAVLDEGKDISNILWEIIKYTNDILIYKVTKEAKLYNKNEIEKIKVLSEKISKEKLLNIIYELSELENNLKWSSQKRIMFEVGLVKLCISSETDGIEELKERINRIEQKIENVANTEKQNNINISQMQNINKRQNIKKDIDMNIDRPENKKEEQHKQKNNQSGNMTDIWNSVVNNLKSSGKITLYANLINTDANQANDMIVEILFPNGITAFGKTVLEKPENKQELERLVSIECGKPMKIKYIDEKAGKKTVKNNISSIEEFANNLDLPIQVSED